MHLLDALNKKTKIKKVKVELPFTKRMLNLIYSFSHRKNEWIENTKKNLFVFKQWSMELEKKIKHDYNSKDDVIFMFEALYSPGLLLNALKPYVIYEDSTPKQSQKNWSGWVPRRALCNEYAMLKNSVYKSADLIFTSNSFCYQSLKKDYRICEEKLSNVYQGFNFTQNRRIPHKNNVILFVGYEFKRKGGELLLDAFTEIKRLKNDIELWIVGTDVDTEMEGVKVYGRIRNRDRLSEIYRRASALVLPSYFDPMPNTVIEAMGFGTPVVVSDKVGTSELIQNGKNGYVIEAGNLSGLVDVLMNILSDKTSAEKVGANGKITVVNKLNWDAIADKIIHKCSELIEK
jgi:glycosyltransferase involved in cell wall biosynthesis